MNGFLEPNRTQSAARLALRQAHATYRSDCLLAALQCLLEQASGCPPGCLPVWLASVSTLPRMESATMNGINHAFPKLDLAN